MSILLDDVRAVRVGLGTLDALLDVDNLSADMELWRPLRDQAFFVQTRKLTDVEYAPDAERRFDGILHTPNGADLVVRVFRDGQGFGWRDAYGKAWNVHGLCVASAAESPSARVGELYVGDILFATAGASRCLGVVERFQVLG